MTRSLELLERLVSKPLRDSATGAPFHDRFREIIKALSYSIWLKMPQPKVSVIVSCYNKVDTIGDCVESILRQDLDEFEAIVVDDGSTDGSLRILEALEARSSLRILRGEHKGISATKNKGFAASKGDVLLFIDGDCILEHGSLAELARCFDEAFDCVGGELRAINSSNLIAKTVELMQNEVERKWPFGANVAYTRRTLEKTGLFDERMAAGEDAELYLRAMKLGSKSMINRKVIARTKNPDSVADFFSQRLKWGKGFCQLTERHPETFTKKIKVCFIWMVAMLLSPLLILLDTRLALAFPALVVYNLMRFTPGTVTIYKRTGDAKHCAIIPVLRFLNALAYLYGWSCWRLLELLGRAKSLDPFVPPSDPDKLSFSTDLPT